MTVHTYLYLDSIIFYVIVFETKMALTHLP